ncbi:hypothetical protein ACFL35_09090 [Candidatus Riflebacteria bacterium]
MASDSRKKKKLEMDLEEKMLLEYFCKLIRKDILRPKKSLILFLLFLSLNGTNRVGAGEEEYSLSFLKQSKKILKVLHFVEFSTRAAQSLNISLEKKTSFSCNDPVISTNRSETESSRQKFSIPGDTVITRIPKSLKNQSILKGISDDAIAFANRHYPPSEVDQSKVQSNFSFNGVAKLVNHDAGTGFLTGSYKSDTEEDGKKKVFKSLKRLYKDDKMRKEIADDPFLSDFYGDESGYNDWQLSGKANNAVPEKEKVVKNSYELKQPVDLKVENYFQDGKSVEAKPDHVVKNLTEPEIERLFEPEKTVVAKTEVAIKKVNEPEVESLFQPENEVEKYVAPVEKENRIKIVLDKVQPQTPKIIDVEEAQEKEDLFIAPDNKVPESTIKPESSPVSTPEQDEARLVNWLQKFKPIYHKSTPSEKDEESTVLAESGSSAKGYTMARAQAGHPAGVLRPANERGLMILSQGRNLSLHCENIALPRLIEKVCREMNYNLVSLRGLKDYPISMSIKNLSLDNLMLALAETGDFKFNIRNKSIYIF